MTKKKPTKRERKIGEGSCRKKIRRKKRKGELMGRGAWHTTTLRKSSSHI